MRSILFFHPKNDYTGSTRVLANIIADEYSEEQIYIITNRNGNKGFLSELPNVHIINVCYLKRVGILKYFSSLVWRIHSLLLVLWYGWRFKTFYINTIIPYYAAMVGTLYRKKIIYHIHEKFKVSKPSVKLAENIFNKTTAHRIFVSQYTKEQYPENQECTWEIKYNKLSESFLKRVRIRPLSERSRTQIIMISSLTLDKGVDIFVRLANLLPEYHFQLIISADEQKIKEFFTDYEYHDNLELIPAQSDIHPFLYQSDLIVNLSNPSLSVETFGLTILEAMPYGIPAIVPNIGGPIELIKNDYNGYCVDVTDLDELTRAIRLALDKDNYKRMSVNALKRFETRFK